MATETAIDVVMPQMGVSVSEGTVTRWLKQEGEHVEADEPLLEISTDKVDTEVPSPASGTLTQILVQEGETVEVGTKLAQIGGAAGGAQPEAPPEAPPAPATQEAAQQASSTSSRASLRLHLPRLRLLPLRQLPRPRRLLLLLNSRPLRSRKRHPSPRLPRHRRPQLHRRHRHQRLHRHRRSPLHRRSPQPTCCPVRRSSRCRRCAAASPSTCAARSTRRRT